MNLKAHLATGWIKCTMDSEAETFHRKSDCQEAQDLVLTKAFQHSMKTDEVRRVLAKHEKEATKIIVAIKRAGTIIDAEQIIVLDEGEIVERVGIEIYQFAKSIDK